MNIWHDLDSKRISPEEFIVCIEISKNSKMKYELDKETGRLILDRVLFTSTHYPANYGFIPRTYAGDYDPLDVLVLCSEDLEPLSIVKCYPIGIIRMTDDDAIDDKIIAIPFNDPNWNHYNSLDELPIHLSEEIVHFFRVYKSLEHKETTILEILGRNDAENVIEEAINNYNLKFCK